MCVCVCVRLWGDGWVDVGVTVNIVSKQLIHRAPPHNHTRFEHYIASLICTLQLIHTQLFNLSNKIAALNAHRPCALEPISLIQSPHFMTAC